jgi:hypothetical protein
VRVKPILLLLLFFALILPAGGQRPGAYFSLSTSKTYLPGEKIGIRVFSNNVEALEFRVYKVKDPVAFFERLQSPHGFGHVTPKEVVETESFLERFHDWKNGIWIGIRDFFRMQFSTRSRAGIREARTEALKTPAGSAAAFAQAPVLNSSQLVARWHQNMRPTFMSETEKVPVDNLQKGVYLVEATDGELRAYTILLVSEMGLVTKAAPGQLVAFAADRRTGAPVSGADLRIWTDKKESARLKSNADGLAESPLPEANYEDVRVLGVHGDDIAMVTPYSYSLSSDPDRDWTGYVYTDRPVYRPTHTVHFKVILRTRSGEHYRVPVGETVQVLIEDPTSKPLLQSKFAISSYGTIHGDLELPVTTALGYYSISINSAGGKRYPATGGFYVEEYKKPEYEVKVTPASPRVLQGSSIKATIEARYYFGEPVAGATVKYVVHTSTYYSPWIDRDEEGDSSFSGGEGEGEAGGEPDEADYAGNQESEQSGKLDAQGRLQIQIPTRLDDHKNDLRYRIEARVTDEANREIAGHNSVIATYGSFVVGISPQSYVVQKGETIRATAIAKDYDGNPVRTSVHIELSRMRSFYPKRDETLLSSQDAQTGSDGTVPITFEAKEEGELILKITARTPENREVTTSSWIWAPGNDMNFWGGESRQIRLVADKKSYQVGDTAHVLVMTGMPEAYLLVTTEGKTVQSKRIVHATAPTVTIDLPIQTDNQPNIYVTVAFLRDNKFYQGQRSLKVPAIEKQLQVEVAPSQKQFQPGQAGTYTISVHDSSGKPVAGEFSLGVVDEAIYAIHPDTSGDISDAFFGPVYDRVTTDSSLSFFFSGDAGKRTMILTYRGLTNPRALAQLKPESLVQPKIRKVFPDSALWVADLHTDANGHAEAKLSFPDSLTSWRATVRGITSDTKIGSATNNVIVRKNLMVRLAVPRFFRQGDEVTVSAIVHNYLASTKTVQVSLDAKGVDVLSGATGEISVPSKGETKLDWRIRAKSVQEIVLQTKALTNEESDAMELTLPVIPVGVKQSDAKSGSLNALDQEEKTTVNLPTNLEESGSGLDIKINSSLAGSIFSALDYLTSYPYGCTEQTMSSFLPDIVVAKAMKDLNLKVSLDTPELEKKIQAGMSRLLDYQHQDGGWGWWKDDESQVFMTAYVVSGYGQAQAAGYDVHAQSLVKAALWLRATLDKYPNMRPDLRAYVLYALVSTGHSDAAAMQFAKSAQSSMTAQGLSMLGLSLQMSGDSAGAREIAEKIESAATVNEQEAYWPSDYDYFMEFEFHDEAETTAYAMRLLSVVKPDSPLLPKAAFWLVSHRNGGYFWDSTKQTAMVVFGLTEYMKASHELDANFHAEVFVNGKQVLTRQFTPADSLNPEQPAIHLDASHLRPGANEIRVHKSGSGRAYWSANGAYYSSDKRLVQNNKVSLSITRDYFQLAPEQTNGKIVYNLNPLQGEMHVGDVLAVRVTVAGSEWRYLLMEDPIPAGAEFITRDDLYELKQRPNWWQFWFTRREFHDDRAAIFQTYLRGQTQYVYLLKIVNPGKFQISPAMVQPMYQPSIMATSDGATLEVKP